MMRLPAWSGLAALASLLLLVRPADAGDPLKPYVLLMLDTSGSMVNNATGFGPPSCGGSDTRLDHAKCAINHIANSYGDLVLGLSRFRQTTTDNTPANGCTMAAGCGLTSSNPDTAFELLVGMVDGNNDLLARWTDFSQNTCMPPNPLGANDDPEVFSAAGTPIGGALVGARLYWQGANFSNGTSPWPAGQPGFSPITNDPLKNVFLPNGHQCRPYIVIDLTDGNEDCGGNPVAAAASLLNTPVGGQNYRIETKVIGFDVGVPDQQIEDIAHAGGAPDGPGNEGQYVQNEEQLQLAISQIIADSLRFEQCNDLDDDCDTLIDEDFPNKGMACHDNGIGRCQGTGVYVCNANHSNTECQITQPGAQPTPEICNGIDDDCDNNIDEGLVCNCTGVEICNNLDDDCDNRIDEDLTRPCGTDVGECTAGTETCTAGMWTGCTATDGSAEVCDGLDNDCDGIADDLSRECSDLPGGNPDVGPCHPGTQVCAPNGNGTWGACLGEVGPTTESCDTIDNDCDTLTDEDTGGADCSGACGVGQTVCQNGVIQCQTMATGGDETCNNHDDDCDTLVDENVPDMGPCNMAPDGTPLCAPGVLRCMGGQYVCEGGDPAQPETCDCQDNDCDGNTDEEPPDLCPGGSTCTHCQCAMPCAAGEFPCPAGRVCVDNFCLVDTCFNVQCDPLPNGDVTECRDGQCVRSCDGVTCGPGAICYGPAGECRPDDCSTFPDRCASNEECVDGTCVPNPCAGVTCSANQYCVGGDCLSGCSTVDCPDGQRCRLGQCETDPCGHPCGFGFFCDETTHECENDPCPGVTCPTGEACDPQDGHCHQDLCDGVTCPNAGEVCRQGTCDVPVPPPDAGVEPDSGSYVTTGGGGGCSTGGGGGGGALAALLAGTALLVRRRRTGGGAS
ncbi:MAG TPA: MopE-related protein [Kofleriaceae bacterium]|nr:MopE-related protein [Kofleriaceae bacterium]